MATAPGGVEVASVSGASSGGSSFGGGSGVGRTVADCWRAGCSRWAVWYSEHVRLNAQVVELTGASAPCEASGRQLAPGGRVWGARRSPPHTMLCVC